MKLNSGTEQTTKNNGIYSSLATCAIFTVAVSTLSPSPLLSNAKRKNTETIIEYSAFENSSNGRAIPSQPRFSERYKNIANSDWFKSIYNDKSIGDISLID